MAKIPGVEDIRRNINYDSGRRIVTINKRALQAPARAVSRLASQAGNIGASITKMAEQEDDFEAENNYLKFVREQEKIAQARRESAEPGAFGFEEQGRADYAAAAKEFLGPIRGKLKRKYDRRLFQLEDRLGISDGKFERKERARHYGEETLSGLQEIQNRILESPEDFDELVKEGVGLIAKIPDSSISRIGKKMFTKTFLKTSDLQRARQKRATDPKQFVEDMGGIPAGLYEMLESNFFEGFRSEAYSDKRTSTGEHDAWRVGIGADIVVRADGDGTPETVTKNTKNVTRADAKRTLEYIINHREGKTARAQVGDAWRGLPVATQHALYSVAYNFGKLPDKIANAAKLGDNELIARAIEENPHNNKRRQREAALVRSGSYGDGLYKKEVGEAASWAKNFSPEERQNYILQGQRDIEAQIDEEYDATQREMSDVQREIDNDIVQILKTGESTTELTFERVEQMRGEKAAVAWEDSRRSAKEEHKALNGLEDLTDSEMAARYNQTSPEDADDPYYKEKIVRAEKVRKDYAKIQKQRLEDSALAVRKSREVQAVIKNFPDEPTPEQNRQGNIDIINAQNDAYERLGIPLDARRTLSKPVAKRYSEYIKKMPQQVEDQLPVDERIALELQAAYGDHADDVFIDIIRAAGDSEKSREEAVMARDAMNRLAVEGYLHETDFARMDAMQEASNVDRQSIALQTEDKEGVSLRIDLQGAELLEEGEGQAAGGKSSLPMWIQSFVQDRGILLDRSGRNIHEQITPENRAVAEPRLLRELLDYQEPGLRDLMILERDRSPETTQNFVDLFGVANLPEEFEVPEDIRRSPPRIRPFDPEQDEPRLNPNKSRSSEIIRTVQMDNGEITNVPSLWWERNSGEPVDLTGTSDDFLAALATRYERETGDQFPRFKTFAEGNASSLKRSAAGGATQGKITDKGGEKKPSPSAEKPTPDQQGVSPVKEAEAQEVEPSQAEELRTLVNDLISAAKDIDRDDPRIAEAGTLEGLRDILSKLQKGTITVELAREAFNELELGDFNPQAATETQLSEARGDNLIKKKTDKDGKELEGGFPLPRPKPGKPIRKSDIRLAVTEFEIDMEPHLDNVARLGFDAEKAHAVKGEGFDVKGFFVPPGISEQFFKRTGKLFQPLTQDQLIERDNVYVASDAAKPSIYAHEFRHRGYSIMKIYLKTFESSDAATTIDNMTKIAEVIKARGLRRASVTQIRTVLTKMMLGLSNEETSVAYMDRHGSYSHRIANEGPGHLAPKGTPGASERKRLIPVVASHLAQIMQGE